MSKELALAFVLFNSEPSKDPWWSCRPREFLSLFGLWDAGWDMLKFRSTSAPAEKQKKNRVYSITRFKQVHQLITLSEDYEKSFYLQFQLRIAAPRHMCLARSSSRPLYHCILSRPCHKPWILQPKEEKQKRRIESVLNPLEIKRQGKKNIFWASMAESKMNNLAASTSLSNSPRYMYLHPSMAFQPMRT